MYRLNPALNCYISWPYLHHYHFNTFTWIHTYKIDLTDFDTSLRRRWDIVSSPTTECRQEFFSRPSFFAVILPAVISPLVNIVFAIQPALVKRGHVIREQGWFVETRVSFINEVGCGGDHRVHGGAVECRQR